MGKNIVICCDGTANQFGEENSNVVKLYSVLQKQQTQLAYYDPGVGTISEQGIRTNLGKLFSIGKGLAFGTGLWRNLEEAYIFLMNNYEEGDKIFLFGFSRGAYTLRVMTGLIHMCGLLHKGCENLLPYAHKIFKSRNFALARKFKHQYAQSISIHFVGLWDTVSSYGFIGGWRNFPHTAKNPDIKNIRHAISIDERRTFYKQNLFNESEMKDADIKQVWFAGAHSDVGGSYPEKESGLAKISLKWMLVEAVKKELQINTDKYNEVVLGISDDYIGPDHGAEIHNSLSGPWWLLELLPRRLYNPQKRRKELYWPWGTRRFIQENIKLHQSVLDRKKDLKYWPENLPKQYIVEPDQDISGLLEA